MDNYKEYNVQEIIQQSTTKNYYFQGLGDKKKILH